MFNQSEGGYPNGLCFPCANVWGGEPRPKIVVVVVVVVVVSLLLLLLSRRRAPPRAIRCKIRRNRGDPPIAFPIRTARRGDPPVRDNEIALIQTFQNLQTNLLGGGFTLPLPPPGRSGPATSLHSRDTPSSFDPYKKPLQTNTFSTFSLFGPAKPAYIPITLAISCFSTSNCLR